MIWMDVDAALSEVPINIAALIDDTDFKTREESVTYNQSGLDLLWNFVTTAGAFTQTAVTPTDTAGVYDWVNQGNGMYTIEIPASAGGTINNDTEGFGWFSGFATGILPWRGPVIGFRAAGLNNALVDSAYSATRGLAGTAVPDAAADAAGGLVISDAGGHDPDLMALAVGLENDAAAAGDPSTSESIMQYVKQLVNVIAGSTGIGTMPAGVNPANGANLFEIIRAAMGSTFDTATDSLEQLQADVADVPTVAEFNARTGYHQRAIWIDTVNGAAGTTDDIHGIESNPVNSIADANTLAASKGISKFIVALDSNITFAAAQTGQVFLGEKWTLALGGQDVAGSVFVGATVSGVMAGTGVLQKFIGCMVNATSVIKGTVFVDCFIASTITVVEAGEFLFRHCASSVAGAGAPTFDFGAALNSSNLSVRDHSGGWEIANMGAGTGTYNSSFEGRGQIIWAASCSATSNASIRGHWRITDNAGGAVTETKDDITLNVVNIQSRIPAALVGGAMDSDVSAMQNAVIAAATFAAAAIDAAATSADFITEINTGTLTQVNAALDTAIAELSQGVPTATPTMRTGLMLMYMALRNKLDVQTSGTDSLEIHNDAGTRITQKLVTDDGTDYSEAKAITGA